MVGTKNDPEGLKRVENRFLGRLKNGQPDTRRRPNPSRNGPPLVFWGWIEARAKSEQKRTSPRVLGMDRGEGQIRAEMDLSSCFGEGIARPEPNPSRNGPLVHPPAGREPKSEQKLSSPRVLGRESRGQGQIRAEMDGIGWWEARLRAEIDGRPPPLDVDDS